MTEISPMQWDRSLIVEVIPSSFGGGWVVPRNDPSREALEDSFFHEPPTPLAPIGGESGYVVEPFDWAECMELLTDLGAIIL